MVVFFVISFITNIIGPIIPEFIKLYDLSLVLASLLPLSFFLAYGIFSIPSGIYLERFGGKKMMIFAFVISLIGALSISIYPNYYSILGSFFLIGSGMAILQVVINPLLRVAVSAKNFAFYSIIGQLVFGLASFLSPIVYGYAVKKKLNLEFFSIESMPWLIIYWMFIIASLLLIGFIINLRIPTIDLNKNERFKGSISFSHFLKDRITYFYFFGIFCYVGVEQGINNWSSEFLFQYHGLDPNTVGVQVISSFWGNLTLGTVISLFLVKVLDGKILLNIYSLTSALLILVALFSSSDLSVLSFKLLGLTISGIWSVMIALALNSISNNHGMFSGILLTGIIGGAIFPFIIAIIGQFIGLKYGMLMILFGLLYIGYVGFFARPIVSNKLII